MSTSDSELDQHLQVLFGGLDTGTDFDARLMARVRAESQIEATERERQARQERARYRRTVLELQSWRRLLTLDTLGIALLLVVAVVTAWPHFSRGINIWRQHGLHIAILLSILIAAVPVLGMWAEHSRRPIRLP